MRHLQRRKSNPFRDEFEDAYSQSQSDNEQMRALGEERLDKLETSNPARYKSVKRNFLVQDLERQFMEKRREQGQIVTDRDIDRFMRINTGFLPYNKNDVSNKRLDEIRAKPFHKLTDEEFLIIQQNP